MTNINKRIAELRTKKGMSREQLSAALGLPRLSVEKFETGRLTPNNRQKEQLASFFGVSLDYLTGETDDTTTMADWLAGRVQEEEEEPVYTPKKVKQKPAPVTADNGDGSLFASLLSSEAFKKAVLEVLKTPEGKELIKKASK